MRKQREAEKPQEAQERQAQRQAEFLNTNSLNTDSDSDSEAKMTEFDQENGTDASDAQQKTSGLKVPWNQADLEFWFVQFENHLESAGVKAQWTKRNLLHKQLDPKVQEDCRDT